MRLFRFIEFILFYTKEVFSSNLRVAYDVLTPKLHMHPGFVAVPIDALNDRQTAVMANLITMTPGTLSVDVSSDHRTLYVHVMFLKDPDALRAEIKQNYERRIAHVF